MLGHHHHLLVLLLGHYSIFLTTWMGRRRTSLVHTAAEEETASTFSRPSVVVCVFNQNRRRGQTRAEDVEEVNDDSKCAFRLRVKALYICLAADC